MEPNQEEIWTRGQLEEIANKVRERILGDRAVTLEEYICQAQKTSLSKIGHFYAKVFKNESRIGMYVPKEVVEIIGGKATRVIIYDEDADEFIKKNAYRGTKWIAKRFYTREYNIRNRTKRICVELNKEKFDWEGNPGAVKYLEKNYHNKTHKELAKHLGLRVRQVRERAYFMGMKKFDEHVWTDEETTFVLDNYLTKPYRVIAEDLGLNKNQVEIKIRRMGLRKR